jgi:hypothetical protein
VSHANECGDPPKHPSYIRMSLGTMFMKVICNTPGIRLAFWTLALHEPKPPLFIYEHGTYETCVYGMCLQHLLETYVTYFC